MSSKRLHAVLPVFLLLPALPHNAGGWDVITVQDLPEYATAGQPVRLAFAVRQHGASLLGGLNGSVVARGAGAEVQAAAVPMGRTGHYVATVTLPRPGDWSITVNSGFGKNNVTLLPLAAVPAGSAPAAMPLAERGRRLFVAKGCVGCHVHSDANTRSTVKAGPDLTGRRYAADYLARYLADPSIKTPSSPNAVRMPNLELRNREIAALVSFINAEGQVSSR